MLGMKAKRVPLVKISGESSIYFDFEKNVPYIQHFVGPFTEKAGKSYSFSETFWLSQALMGGVAIIANILNGMFDFPVLLSIIIAIVTGMILGKFFIQITIVHSFGKREYRELSVKEIEKALSNSKNVFGLRVAEIFMIVILFFVLLIPLLNGDFDAQSFVMTLLGVFVVTGIHSAVSPKLALKARKILKKQLKEGKFE